MNPIALPLLLAFIPLQDDGSVPTEKPHPVTAAYEKFTKATPEKRSAIVDEITRSIEACPDPGVRQLLELRNRAVLELKIVKRENATYYDPAIYAPQIKRHFVDGKDPIVKQTADRFERVGAVPVFAGRVAYDFARNVGVDSQKDPSSEDALWNYLYGYPPGADVLVAWLEMKLDHDDSIDELARHFAHCYCDLDGTCFPDITLFDAFASESNIDMPDPDVIPYARLIEKDDSFVSPIPPDERQQILFRQINENFLRYFRHRTFVEYCANLYVNPDIPISYAHEQLRERILYAFHLDGHDLLKIRNRLIRYGDRHTFVNLIDKTTLDDPYWRGYAQVIANAENETRWVIARLAHDVLRQQGFLED